MSFAKQPRVTVSALAVLIATAFIARATAADPAKSAEERITKVKADLTSNDVSVRQAAIGSLIHSDISGMLFAEMQRALADRDGNVRSTAATAIGNLGAGAVPAIEQLAKQLKSDPVKEARETAARALGRIGTVARDRTPVVAPLTAASQDDADPVTRVVAHGALALVHVELAQQITTLRRYLHHDEALVRMKAAHALGMIGISAKAAAPEIVDVLKRETDPHRRGYVARSLGLIGDPASLPAPEAALEKETDRGTQGEMRGAISRLKTIAAEKVQP